VPGHHPAAVSVACSRLDRLAVRRIAGIIPAGAGICLRRPAVSCRLDHWRDCARSQPWRVPPC
jgi:hypothetical protein